LPNLLRQGQLYALCLIGHAAAMGRRRRDDSDPPPEEPVEPAPLTPTRTFHEVGLWQFDDDDEAPTHPDRVAHRANIEEVTVVMTGGDFDAALDELDEPPPAAVRPLGRLGGDVGGSALALDYAAPLLASEAADGDVGVGLSEVARLELWLAGEDAEAPTAIEGPTEIEMLEGWLQIQLAAPATDRAQSVTEVDRLESWLTMQPDEQPVMLEPNPPVVIAPNPIRDAEQLRIEIEPAVEEIEPDELLPEPLLALDTYASVKVAIWDQGKSLLDVLAAHELEETIWRENELIQTQRMAAEASVGDTAFVMRLMAAVKAARAALPQDHTEPSRIPLDVYAEVRVRIEAMGDATQDDDGAITDLLLTHHLTVLDWERHKRAWIKHARGHRDRTREVRRAVAQKRRELKAERMSAAGEDDE